MPTRGLLKEHSSLEQRTDGKTLGRFLAMWLILPSQQHRDGKAYEGAPNRTFFSRTKTDGKTQDLYQLCGKRFLSVHHAEENSLTSSVVCRWPIILSESRGCTILQGKADFSRLIPCTCYTYNAASQYNPL